MSEQKTKLETLLACLPDAPFKQHLTAEIESLEAQLQECRKDAERYRWLRTPPNNIDARIYAPTHAPESGGLLRRDCYLDAAIDAAMSQEKADHD